MDSPEQRRKRKRIVRTPPLYSLLSPLFLSVRSLILCLAFISFITFLYFVSHLIPITSSSFHPVLVVSRLSLSSSSSTDHSIRDYSSYNFLSKLKIEDRVLFPDHVLLLVLDRDWNGWVKKSEELECVYSKLSNNSSDFDEIVTVKKRKVLSVDGYNEFRFIVRCPLPPVNYSAVVDLRRRRDGDDDGLRRSNQNQTVRSWDNMAYEAILDGDTAVVFVKGLNLRPHRESNPNQFNCHFGLGNRVVLKTKAISAAQEVVRCLVPGKIRKNLEKGEGIRVTIGIKPLVRARAHVHALLPSAAKIFSSEEKKKKKNVGKYELCVCTMVWNQASSLREWIIYHAWLGVQRWFIYDNNSDDGIKEVIEELEQEDYNVSRHVWPWIKTQEAGFSHCALRAREECNWVSFMDVDEFFYFPVPTFRHLRFKKWGFPGQNSLRALVSNFSSSATIAEIRTACHSFGPSGLSSTPSQGVAVGYTCRLQSPERHKSIVRPNALDVTLLNVVHHFHLRKGFRYLNLPPGIAVINHYKYQVWEAFRAKFYRRVATYVVDWQESQNEGSKDRAPGLGTEPIEPPNWRLQFCEVWDTGLRDFALANLADPATGLLPWERSPL